MRFPTTFLAATAVGTVLPADAALWIGAPAQVAPWTGLTAATILATDGVGPDAGPTGAGRGSVASGESVGGATPGDRGRVPSASPQG